MKIFFLFFLLLPSLLFPQWLEDEIFLPDSFGGVSSPIRAAWDSIRDRLFLPGHEYSTRILILDCENDEKLPPIDPHRGTSGLGGFCFNPLTNWFYTGSLDTILVIDCASRQIIDKIPIPNLSPRLFFAVNKLNNKIYLAFHIYRPPIEVDSFFIVDGWTNQIIKRFSIPLGPSTHYEPPMIWNPYNNKVYYITSVCDKIYIIDGETDSLDSINTFPLIPTSPHSMVLNNQGDRLYLFAEDTISRQFYLLFLDCQRNQIVHQLRVSISFPRIAYNPIGERLYLTGALGESDKILVIDLNQGVIIDSIPFPGETHPCHLKFVPRYNRLYFFLELDTLVGMIDGNTNQILGYIPIPDYFSFTAFVFHHPIRDKLYFSLLGGTIGIIDCVQNHFIKEIYPGSPGGEPYDLVFNPLTNKLYASEPQSPRLMIFDAVRNRTVKELYLGEAIGRGRGIGHGTVCTNLNKVYFSCGGGPILVLDGNTDSLLTVIWDIPDHKKLYYLEDLNKIFAVPPCLFTEGWTYIIDCHTDLVIDQILTLPPTYGFAYSPRTNKLYIASGYGGYGYSKTRIIDARTHRIIKVIPNICGDIKYDPRNERIYISDGWPSCDLFQARRVEPMRIDTVNLPRSLFVLDGFSDSIINYLPGGEGYSLALDTFDNRLYNACFDYPNYYIKVIDLETLQVIDTIEDNAIHSLFWNPINNKLYSGWLGIRAIDCRTNRVVWEYEGDAEQIHLGIRAWYPELNRLYLPTTINKILVIRDEVSGIKEKASQAKFREFAISPTIGSSFNISWRGKEKGKVIIYNPSGRKVCTMELNPGKNLIWEGKDERDDKLPSGIYFLKLERDRITEKIILK
ncbi:MAG: hypothetical protein ABIK84_02495 [candidate division WOR-3 bacterium]